MDGAAGSGGLDAAAGANGSDGAAGMDASGTDAAVDAGFSIASLPGLVMWLDASKGTTVASNNVSTWKDQTSNANDAVKAGSANPMLLAGAINGLPAVQFGAGADMTVQGFNGSPTLGFGTGDFLVEVVAAWTAGGNFSILFQTNLGPSTLFFTLLGDGGHATALLGGTNMVSTASATLGNGAFHLVGARRTGVGADPTLEVRVNGAADGTATGSNFAQDLQSLVVGEVGPGNSQEIAELIVVKGSTSAADLARLETYLKTKYGL